MRPFSRRFMGAAVAALTIFGPAAPAAALDASGHAVRVNPAVNARGPGGERLMVLEGAVFMGDQIVANPHGMAQIRFIDNTRLVIGPNSLLTIDAFVFDPDLTARNVTMTSIKGTFRFISGKSPKGAYTLRTPTATIGVRG